MIGIKTHNTLLQHTDQPTPGRKTINLDTSCLSDIHADIISLLGDVTGVKVLSCLQGRATKTSDALGILSSINTREGEGFEVRYLGGMETRQLSFIM